jgi:hypothetical protein
MAAAASAPKGYVIVGGATRRAPYGHQTSSSVDCPTGTVPFGGGVYTPSVSLYVNVATSAPTSTGWTASLANFSGHNTTFGVSVVCAKAPKLYQQVTTGPVPNPARGQSSDSVTCPAGTVVLGGGSSSASSSTQVGINTSIPRANGWRVNMNNADFTDTTFTVDAICAKKPRGWTSYVINSGTPVDNPGGADTYAEVACPGTSVPLSGGLESSSNSMFTDLNVTDPTSTTWYGRENNTIGFDSSLTAWVVCAGI